MMMGCCTATGMVFGLLGMLTPLIAIGAVIYLLAAKSRRSRIMARYAEMKDLNQRRRRPRRL